MIFVDHYTRYTWFYKIKSNTDVKIVFQKFQYLVERIFYTKIKSIYTDGSGEFPSLQSHLHTQGIEDLKSPPYTPQIVAFAEHKSRHIIETAKTVLHQNLMPLDFWSSTCHHNVYLINRMIMSTLANKLPYEYLFRSSPD